MIKVLLATVLAFTSLARAEREVTVSDGVRGEIDLRISDEGDIEVHPRPDPAHYRHRLWTKVFEASQATLWRFHVVEAGKSRLLNELRPTELVSINERTFVVVRERGAPLDAPNYLQEVRAQFGRRLHFMEMGVSIGLPFAIGMAMFYPYEQATLTTRAISAGVFVVMLIHTLWEDFKIRKNATAEGSFMHQAGQPVRVDEIVRDGDHVRDLLISVPGQTAPSQSLRELIDTGCEPALAPGAFKLY